MVNYKSVPEQNFKVSRYKPAHSNPNYLGEFACAY